MINARDIEHRNRTGLDVRPVTVTPEEAAKAIADILADLATLKARIAEERAAWEKERALLCRVLDAVLIEVEPLRHHNREWIEEQIVAKRAWAKEVNANRKYNEEPWVFITEYRRMLESQFAGLAVAIREACAVLEAIEHTSSGERREGE